MIRMHDRRLWVVSSLLLLVGHLPGRSCSAAALDLHEAVEKALRKSPAVSAVEETVQAARAREQAAFSGFLPRVGFQELYTRTDQPVASFGNLLNQSRFTQQDFALNRLNDPDSLDNFQTRLSVEQPLFTGGRAENRLRMARHERESAQWDLQGAVADVGYQTIRAYWGLSLAEESVRVAEMAVATAQESLRQIELLHAEGTVVRSDLLSARVRLAGFQDRLVRARGEAKVAETALRILIGDSPEGRWEVSPLATPGQDEIPGLDPGRLLESAKERRPDYVSLGAQAEAASAGLRAARGSFLPQLGVQASYEWNSPRFTDDLEGSYLLGVGLEWSLFEGLRDYAGLKEAAAHERAVRYRVRTLEDRMRLEIEQAVTELQTNRESLQVTQEQVSQAEENLRIVRHRYSEGLTTVVELEQAQLSLSHSRLQRLQAIHALRISLARLDLATGELARSLGASGSRPVRSEGPETTITP
ncbi:MAG: TolC family protein [bacterium]